MKCLFCGAELEKFPGYGLCNNEECCTLNAPLPDAVWQALIDGKAAQDALKAVSEDIEAIIHEWNRGGESIGRATRTMCALACHAQDIIKNITEQK